MRRKFQSGVALAIVVWFLAAMSLLVAGIVSQAKVDTRMAQGHVARAHAVAAGDGAIQLMLAALQSKQIKGYRGRGVPQLDFEVGEQDVNVSLVPVAGLIDLNGASRELLVELFAGSGTESAEDAQILAENVMKWRDQISASTRQKQKFNSLQDLLRVEGVGRTLFENIRDSVAVAAVASRGVDWMSAPESVLRVLNGGKDDVVTSVLSSREGSFSPSNSIPRGLNARFQIAGSGNDYRVDALVTVGDKQWLRRRWVSVETQGEGLLPWRFTGTEPVRSVDTRNKEN
ncbi:MAG: general secretion pathway protein K [Halioglobus sp.]